MFIALILIVISAYILGAHLGFPKFGMSTKGYQERIEFLSELQDHDRLKSYKSDDDDLIITRIYIVKNNDPVNQQIGLEEYGQVSYRSYDSKYFKDLIKLNESLLQTIIKRNRETASKTEETSNLS